MPMITTPENRSHIDITRYFHPQDVPRALQFKHESATPSVDILALCQLALYDTKGWRIVGRWQGRDEQRRAPCTPSLQILLEHTLPDLFHDPDSGMPANRFIGAVALLAYGFLTGQLEHGVYALTPVIEALSLPSDLYDDCDPRRISGQRPISKQERDAAIAFAEACADS